MNPRNVRTMALPAGLAMAILLAGCAGIGGGGSKPE